MWKGGVFAGEQRIEGVEGDGGELWGGGGWQVGDPQRRMTGSRGWGRVWTGVGVVQAVVHRRRTASAAALGGGLDAAGELLELFVDGRSFLHEAADFLGGVHDGGVVPTAEGVTDFRQR